MDDTTLKPTEGFEYYRDEIYWNNFDQVYAQMSTAVSGNPEISWMRFLQQQYGARESGLFINCGNGWVERDCYRAGLIRSAIGFDVNPALIGIASAEAKKVGMPARYFQADGNRLPNDNLACDLIVNHGAMHHIAYIDKLTRELASYLTPDGMYIINDYTGPHRNQYSWEAVFRTIEINQSLPEEYRVELGYAHIPTMLSLDPTEAIHSELQLNVARRYFNMIREVQYGGAIAYTLLFGNHNLYRDQRAAHGATVVRAILDADHAFLREMPESNLFTFAVCTPKTELPGQAQLDHWRRLENDREMRAGLNGGRYYPTSALELIYGEIVAKLAVFYSPRCATTGAAMIFCA